MSRFWYTDQTVGVSEWHATLDFSPQNSHLPRIASQHSGTFTFGGAFISTWTTDGLRCVVGTIVRIATRIASGGTANHPEAGDASISTKGGIGPDGALRRYQVWYRNADPRFCTPSTFNLTNGYEVVWLP